MRILVLLNRVPWPLNDGGAIGSYHFVRGYADAGCEVHCLAMNTSKHYVELKDTADGFNGVAEFISIPVDNRIRLPAALMNLFTGRSFVTERFRSADFEQQLRTMLQKNNYDVVHIDGLPCCQYMDLVKQFSKAKMAYRAHNVEFLIWQRAAEAEKGPLKKWYLGLQARRLKAFEAWALGKADSVLAISVEDEEQLHKLQKEAKTVIVPAGIDIDASKPVVKASGFSLFFIGALDWLPNLQGLEWFIKEIWPAVHQEFPDLELHIAGKKMPPQVYAYAADKLIIHGEVPSSADFINQHKVLLSPLLSGSGVRIKLIEAMTMGKVVLSTSVSAEGSGAEDGIHLLLADDKEAFLKQIRRLMKETGLQEQLSENARAFAIEKFQNKNVIAALLSHYEELCNS